MTDPLLRVHDLRTWFATGGRPARAVDGVSLDIHRGQTYALLGESGCGKSMTALSIMGLVPHPAGRIVGGSVIMDGVDLLSQPEVRLRALRGDRISMIFQEPMTSLNPVLTVGEQIGEVLRLHRRLDRQSARRQTLELLDAVGIPDAGQRIEDYPHNLSGGMKQRVMIAAALAGDPALLIADEPTTALDVTIQAQVLDLLRDLQRERHMAIFLITHDLGIVASMADRVGVMYAGHLVEEASRAAFFNQPRHPYSVRLFEALPDMNKRAQDLAVIPGSVPPLDEAFTGCRFAGRCELAWSLCRERSPRWIDVGESHGVRCHLVDPEVHVEPVTVERGAGASTQQIEQSPRAPLLTVTDLKVHFPIRKGLLKRVVGHVYAVDGVSMTIPSAHTLALVGESGCGKTTVGKGILRLLKPTAGSVSFDDVALDTLSARALRARRSDFQVIFQDPFSSLNPRMLVGEIIEEGMEAQGIGEDRAARRRRVEQLLEQVGMAPSARDRYPHEFSGGQRQRIAIARALAVDPRLIVCDEPTSALDVSVQAQILNLLKRLQIEFGISYLFITHNIAVVGYLAHEVAVMYLGRIVERGPVEAVLQRPAHPYTQALLAAVPTVDGVKGEAAAAIRGELPSPILPPRGCHFHPRCPHVMPLCREQYPPEHDLGAGQATCCHLYLEVESVSVSQGRSV
jgi:peptide/nickel transport system ATP-binding protein